MPTIIDQLIVTLGLDPKGYTAGRKQLESENKRVRDDATRTGKEMEARGKQAADFYSQVRKEVIALFAAFTAGKGLKDFVEQTIGADAAAGRLAKNLGVATEELSAWQGVLRRAGGAAQDADAGLQTIVKAGQDIALTGQSALIPYFQLLGVSLRDLQNPSETLLKIADRFSKMDPRQAAALGQGMGFSPAMISLLERGRGAVSAMLVEQRKLGVITDQDARAAQQLQNVLSSLNQALSTVGRTLLTIFAPAMEVASSLLTGFAEWAQRNQPIVIGAFAALSAAAIGLGVAMLAPAAPFILTALAIAAVGAAIGGLVELLLAAWRWFTNLVQTNAQLHAAWRELADSATALGSAIMEALRPLFPVFQAIWDVVKAVGSAIADAFGPAAHAAVNGFVNVLTQQFHVVADVIRAVAALLRGDLRGALAAAKDFALDSVGIPRQSRPGATAGSGSAPPRAGGSASAQPSAGGSVAPSAGPSGGALGLVRGFEGFISGAKWDKNAFRAGYGSDTVTDPATGRVSRVTPQTRVTREQAEADLRRRLGQLTPRVAASVGAAWSTFSQSARDALTSVAYNYGRLPGSVLRAARTGDLGAVAAAIKAHASDNGGINARRRQAEAATLLAGSAVAVNDNAPGAARATPQQLAGAAGGGSTTFNFGDITVNTKATDAAGIAKDIAPALRRSVSAQLNSGLG